MNDTALGIAPDGTWLRGLTILSAPDNPESLTEARNYISAMHLTSDDVKIVRRGSQLLVICKRDIREDRSPDPE
jgi:ribosomal protein L36